MIYTNKGKCVISGTAIEIITDLKDTLIAIRKGMEPAFGEETIRKAIALAGEEAYEKPIGRKDGGV